ncbi:MAG: MMPL family transporter [Candidatus Sericytochromatia bacterium]|nr:MMPL family transporter [Candidatus Sericytochromatia bacterium]
MSQMPQDIEAVRAIRQLQATGNGGALIPIQILVQFPDTVLTVPRASGLLAITEKLRQDPRVGDVYAVADPARGGDHLLMNLAAWDPSAVLAQLPEALHALISRDTKSTLIYVIPNNAITLVDACRFARELTVTDWRTYWPQDPGTVTIGGPLTIANEFQDLTRRYLPRLLLIVAGGTFLMLLAYTRSVVIPLKAVLANLLTVGAALGATAALFRSDLGMWLFGLESPLITLGPAIPMVTFCVVFGLSMDYEIFLLSPILEAHRRGDGDADAVLTGVTASAGLITAAASVMAIVFFGFALTGFVAVKFLGIALGLGILLDATVTRLVLIPAAMLVFGRWNWWPGDRHLPAD